MPVTRGIFDYLQTSPVLVFIAAFSIAVALQTPIWITPNPYGDSLLWNAAAHTISHGSLPDLNTPTPAHPGTSILLPAAGLLSLGISKTRAVEITMIVLIAAVIALIASLCASLYPHSRWWIAVIALLAPDERFFSMTPPSAFAALLVSLYSLLLYRYLYRETKLRDFTALSITGGILLATRLDMGLFLLAASLFFVSKSSLKEIVSGGLIALTVFCALDPYLWTTPLTHLLGFIQQVHENLGTRAEFGYGFETIIIAAIGFLLGFNALLRPRLSSLPRTFLVWTIGITIVLTTILINSHYNAMRYFFPLIILWEVLTPLLLFEVVDRTAFFQSRRLTTAIPVIFIVSVFVLRSSLIPTLWFTFMVLTGSTN